MKRLRRIFYILLITFVSLTVLLFIFISPITKWAIEKYSVEYTGRQIKMDKLWINLFTGSVSSKNFRIYEAKENRVFFGCKELYAHLTLRKLLVSKYELTDIRLTKPQLVILQKGNRFNFSDLIDRFDKPSPPSETKSKPVEWSISHFLIDSADIAYTNYAPYNTIKIEHCTVDIPNLAWNNPAYSINTRFDIASGGSVKMQSDFNKNTLLYSILLHIQQFNIRPFYTYLKDYLKVHSLDGLVSTDLKLTGNMQHASAIAASGTFKVEKFSIIDNVNDRLTAVDDMDLKIDSINTEKNIYRFATIELQRPYLKLEMYKDGYNFNRLYASPAATTDTSSLVYSNMFTLIADYIQEIVQDYVVSDYNADKLVVRDGQFVFCDYTLHDKFRYDFDSLFVLSDRISRNRSKIFFDAHAILNRNGSLKGKMDINPNDFKDFDIDCTVKNLRVSDLNPYSKYYVATPFLDGNATYTNKTVVVKRQLKSDNLLEIDKIIAGKKDKTYKPQYNMPVRLAVAILRDVHGNIKLAIPVAGSLDDPKFKFGKIIWQVLGNLLTKAATAPFRLLAGAFGGKEEDYKEIDFDYLQTSLTDVQQRQLDQLAKMIKTKPEIKLELIQVVNQEDEMENLAVSLAKVQYVAHTDTTAGRVSQQIGSVLTDDSLFVRYVDSTSQAGTSFLSTQEKCVLLIGKEKLQQQIDSVMQQRNQTVQAYLQQQQVPAQNLYIHNTGKPNNPNLGNFPKMVINVAIQEDAPGKQE